jgi:ribonuclease VapC
MIVDSSAIISILKHEDGWQEFAGKLDSAARCAISAATYLELSIVVERWKNPALSRRLDEIIEEFEIETLPFTFEQAQIARQAYRDYGKGSGHPAKLNFGDCFSYALARDKRELILYKGDDFGHTNLRSALTATS